MNKSITKPSVWYWHPMFQSVSLLLIVLYTILLLPQEYAVPSLAGILNIFFLLGCAYAWMINFILDRTKPELLKNLLALAFIFLHGLLFYRYAGANWNLLGRQFFDFKAMQPYWHILFRGFLTTLKIGLICIVFVPIIGLLLAIFRSFNNRIINVFVTAYADVFRSMPDIVLIVVVYYALPYLGLRFSSTIAVMIAITLLYSAYATEIFRSGIESIGKIQIEAAQTTGLNFIQIMRFVILPQAIRVVIPPMTSILVGVMRSSAVASVAAAPELLTRARQLSTTINSITPLVVASVIYALVILPLVILSSRMEKVLYKYRVRN